jgi:hypothetical protein
MKPSQGFSEAAPSTLCSPSIAFRQRHISFMYIMAPIYCSPRISGLLPRATIEPPKPGNCLDDPSIILALALCCNVKKQGSEFFPFAELRSRLWLR